MQRQLFQIIAAPLVQWLRAEGFPMPQPPIRFYPDGSLWTDDHNVLIVRRNPPEGVEQLIQRKLPGAYASLRFRPIAAFGGDEDVAPNYSLTYPGWYAWMVSEHDEVNTLMHPGICKPASAEEYDPSHVHVRIKLYRKITRSIARDLAGAVKQWFDSIGSQGVFGESGISSISTAMRLRGRDVAFELDARQSGQETLNTLYLAVLNWGMARRQPLYMIDLAADRNEKTFVSELSVPLK